MTGDFSEGGVAANGVAFRYIEAGQGPLALCMHGFPDNARSFRFLVPELAQSGFRAVAPFMRGYAPTEVPKDGWYQSAALGQDVLALIEALGAQTAVLIGHDWGARAALAAAILGPEKVSQLVTIASAHPGAGEAMNYHYLKGTWHAFYFQLPYAAHTVAHDDFAFIEEWWRDASPEWDIPGDHLESVKGTFRQPGVVDAALAYYRQTFNPTLQDPNLKELQERVNSSPVPVPTLALHGTRDRPRRLESFQAMDGFYTGGLEKFVVEGTGHFIHMEKPQEVNSRIVRFLAR